MKNKGIFNSIQEISYRIVLLLNVNRTEKMSLDRLISLDFLAVYGQFFGISKDDLHGKNRLRFSEYSSRRHLFKEAINKLVVLGLVKFYPQDKGFLFGISQEGIKIAEEFNDLYAEQYQKNMLEARKFAQHYSDLKLTQLISEHSVKAAEEE